ncbi:MAG: P-II family nitrogen regulator [Bauldia sp.]|nr:P-II family nitrogen regulator [Bauldia sp.]
MRFKLILALVQENRVEAVLKEARRAGATGVTVLPSARGEGLVPKKTFLGLNLTVQRDIVLFIVEESLCKRILDGVGREGRFESEPGSGLAIQVDIEDAIGLTSQMKEIATRIESEP